MISQKRKLPEMATTTETLITLKFRIPAELQKEISELLQKRYNPSVRYNNSSNSTFWAPAVAITIITREVEVTVSKADATYLTLKFGQYLVK